MRFESRLFVSKAKREVGDAKEEKRHHQKREMRERERLENLEREGGENKAVQDHTLCTVPRKRGGGGMAFTTLVACQGQVCPSLAFRLIVTAFTFTNQELG